MGGLWVDAVTLENSPPKAFQSWRQADQSRSLRLAELTKAASAEAREFRRFSVRHRHLPDAVCPAQPAGSRHGERERIIRYDTSRMQNLTSDPCGEYCLAPDVSCRGKITKQDADRHTTRRTNSCRQTIEASSTTGTSRLSHVRPRG